MTIQPNIKITERKVRLKSIALPNEHGSWGFLFEPIVAALAIAFSLQAIWVSLLVIGAFLMRQPIKVLLADKLAKRKLPQTELALKFSILYGLISLIGMVGGLISINLQNFVPFLLVSPLVVYQIYCDAVKKNRQFLPEITGAIAISSSAAVIALTGGWEMLNAYSLWLILIARLIPSIIYVRNRLRLEKGKEFSFTSVIISNLMAVLVIEMMYLKGLVSLLTVFVFLILMLRAIWGISPLRKKVKAMRIGVWEVIYGVLTVLSIIIGYYLKI